MGENISEQEKIAIIEDILEVAPGSLNLDSNLSDIEEWDSLAIMSLLAFFDTEYHVKLTSKDIKKIVFVKDLVNLM